MFTLLILIKIQVAEAVVFHEVEVVHSEDEVVVLSEEEIEEVGVAEEEEADPSEVVEVVVAHSEVEEIKDLNKEFCSHILYLVFYPNPTNSPILY